MARLIVTLALCLTLTACGWHVRGTAPGAASLEGVSVAVVSRGGPGQLPREVTRSLQAAGAEVVSAGPGVPTLVLYDERRGVRNISGGRRDEVQEFELRYSVDWELLDGTGEPLIQRSSFEQIRNFRFEQTQVLGSERREDALVAELQRDFAMLLQDRIRATLGERDELDQRAGRDGAAD